jgi:hypothetical protein
MDFMVHKKPIKMSNEREKNGQFAKGHPGFKPVGAVKRKSNHERLKEIFDTLSLNLENYQPNIGYLSIVELMMKITKITMQDKKKKKKKPQPNPQP